MVQVEAPPRSPRPDELEALIEEARDRQRRRRVRVAALVVVAAAAALTAYAVERSRSGSATAVRSVPGGPTVNVSAFAGHGQLAFVSRRAIWVLDGGGRTLRRLPRPPGFYPQQPLFSPDGHWLAYVQTTTAPSERPDASPDFIARGDRLWIAHGDGTGAHPVRGITDAVLLGWSPARDVLAMAAAPLSTKVPYQSQTTLRLVSPDGSSRVLVHAPLVKSAAWSPDGARLAVVTEGHRLVDALVAYPVSGGTPKVWLTLHQHDHLNGMTEPLVDVAGWWRGFGIGVWAFGNGMIHNNDNTPLDVLAAPQARPRLLGQTLSDGTTDVIAAGAGARLAIVADVSHGNGGGRVVWDKKAVELCAAAAPCRPLAQRRSKVTLDPAWSPDGRTLAFIEAPDLSFPGWPQKLMQHWYGAHELWLYDTTTNGMHRVPAAAGATVPAWSRDGKSVLYIAGNGIWLLPALTGKPVEIASPLFARGQWPAYYGQVAWSAQFAWSPPR